MAPTAGTIIAALCAVAAGVSPAFGAQEGGAGLLYAYEIDRGRSDDFEAGYKAHLEWHAAQDDRLVWYAWYVVAGARIGAFVDGTFGAPFSAIDRRPAPGEDGAHFTENVAPYATPTRYAVYELWRAPSSSFTLEERAPTRFVDAYFLEVRPAETAAFEKRLLALGEAGGAPLTWYRAGPGAAAAGYMILAPRENWAAFDARGVSFTDLMSAAYKSGGEAIAGLARSVETVDSEIWAYQPDLSYFPESE